ncbi:TPA: hypothetical protein ACU1RX_002478 [Staphylococcus aureus]|nr:hypothetical protein [Staphylococcus aureus]MBU9769737.1 hypothetical protein [Staphylococcus aureus]MCE5083755.1 hypothetical protein [Staphylococcus aureus]MCE5089019.1 hypothetical protein [Staphylococcus aureus]MCE5134664.1 hypothetical protein [Staphylococcus aureus]MCE5137142.1 hypothetical protein [Staphylococcus aureus]
MVELLLISKNHLSMYGWMLVTCPVYFSVLSAMNFLISVVK